MLNELDLFDVYEANTELAAVEYDGGSDLGLFETYGQDLKTVLQVAKKYPRRVWTLIDIENGGTAWINGYRVVNRILYAITHEDGQQNESFVCFPAD